MKTILLTLTFLLLTQLAFSQATGSPAKNPEYPEKNEFQISVGSSLYRTSLIATSKVSWYGAINLRYARIFQPGRHVSVKYTVDITPINVMTFPLETLVNQGGNNPVVRLTKVTRSGIGVAPFGIQVNFRRTKRIQPFLGGSAGFIYFKQRVPDELGERFNFTGDVGAGVQFMLKNKKAVTIGTKYYHISNGFRGPHNPGFDANVFYVGYSIFK